MKKILLVAILCPFLLFAQSNEKQMGGKGVDITRDVPEGLSIGDEAPLIKAKSLDGKMINSYEIVNKKNLVIIFYRGKWCPVCNRYLSNLNDSLKYITNKAEVIVVGPETVENAEETAHKTGGDFILIPDIDLKISLDYDVLFSVTKFYQRKIKTFKNTDIAKNNNQDVAQLPVPATYIVGKSGKIIYRHFDFDYKNRATVKDILDNLE